MAEFRSVLDSKIRQEDEALEGASSMVNSAKERAAALDKLLEKAAKETKASKKFSGSANKELLDTLSEGYNPAGMFIGPAAKTWNKAAAKLAESMEKNGADPRSIWKETGTWRGRDNKLRQEISDEGMKVKKVGKSSDYDQSIKDTVSHPELEKAYPQLFDRVKTRLIKSDEEGSGGMMVGSSSGNFYDKRNLPQKIKDVVRTRSFKKPLGNYDVVRAEGKDLEPTLAHELQHVIQRGEKFGSGSNLKDEMSKIPTDELLKGSKQDQFNRAFNAYNQVPGEAEARATAARLYMNDAERRNMFPVDSYDVPFKKGGKVKAYANGGSVSSASKRGDGIAQRGKTKGRMC